MYQLNPPALAVASFPNPNQPNPCHPEQRSRKTAATARTCVPTEYLAEIRPPVCSPCASNQKEPIDSREVLNGENEHDEN
jgi:hypothetical protein